MQQRTSNIFFQASIADILKTEQSFSYLGINKFSYAFNSHRFLLSTSTVAKKTDYIIMVNIQ